MLGEWKLALKSSGHCWWYTDKISGDDFSPSGNKRISHGGVLKVVLEVESLLTYSMARVKVQSIVNTNVTHDN